MSKKKKQGLDEGEGGVEGEAGVEEVEDVEGVKVEGLISSYHPFEKREEEKSIFKLNNSQFSINVLRTEL